MSTRVQSFAEALAAVRAGDLPSLQALLAVAPAVARARSTDQSTLLHHAAELGRTEAVDRVVSPYLTPPEDLLAWLKKRGARSGKTVPGRR